MQGPGYADGQPLGLFGAGLDDGPSQASSPLLQQLCARPHLLAGCHPESVDVASNHSGEGSVTDSGCGQSEEGEGRHRVPAVTFKGRKATFLIQKTTQDDDCLLLLSALEIYLSFIC